MSTITVCFVDENDVQRRAFANALAGLFADSGISIKEMAPLPKVEDYAALLADGSVMGLILDQKMEDGGVGYSGTQLSAHLRGFMPKLPIVILSNYTDDPALFEQDADAVEYLISKKTIVDPTARDAQIFKARFLRRLSGYADLIGARAQRFHDLLVKSLKESLNAEEAAEMGLLESERLLPQQAKEIGDVKALQDAITELKKRLNKDDLPLA